MAALTDDSVYGNQYLLLPHVHSQARLKRLLLPL